MKKVPEEERLTAQECLTAWQRVLTVGRSYCQCPHVSQLTSRIEYSRTRTEHSNILESTNHNDDECKM